MSKWINVKDELPEFNEVILVWDGFAIMQAALLGRANGEVYYSVDSLRIGRYRVYSYAYENITHWMSMPELPHES